MFDSDAAKMGSWLFPTFRPSTNSQEYQLLESVLALSPGTHQQAASAWLGEFEGFREVVQPPDMVAWHLSRSLDDTEAFLMEMGRGRRHRVTGRFVHPAHATQRAIDLSIVTLSPGIQRVAASGCVSS